MSYARLTRASLSLALQRGLPALVILAIGIMIAHGLQAADVARFGVIAALVSIARIAADFGLERAIARSSLTRALPELAGQALLLRIATGVLAGGFVFLSGSVLVGADRDLTVASAIPIAQCAAVVAVGWAVTTGRTAPIGLGAGLGAAVAVVVSFFLLPTVGLTAAFLGLLAGAAVESAASWRGAGVRTDLRGEVLRGSILLARDATAFGAQAILGIVYARIPLLLLITAGPTSVAAFSLAYALYGAWALIPGALALAVFPRLSAAWLETGSVTSGPATREYAIASGVVVGAALIAAALAPYVSEFLFTRAYADVADPLRILLLGIPLSATNAYLSLALFAMKRDRTAVIFSILALAMVSLVTWMLLPLQARGAALAVVATEGAICVAALLVLWHRRLGHR